MMARTRTKVIAKIMDPDGTTIEWVTEGDDLLIVFNGLRIAKRGHPHTPQAKTWVSIEPGWSVFGGDVAGGQTIVQREGVRVH
jgi:hypothetical protein